MTGQHCGRGAGWQEGEDATNGERHGSVYITMCKMDSQWGSAVFISFRIFQFIVIHTVKDFGIINKAEIDVFLELSCFSHDPADVGSLISGSSAFSKTSLNIWNFTVHVLLKPGLENFEHYFTSV